MKTLENLTTEELWKLRSECVIGSIYTTDYNNSFHFDEHDLAQFFDGYLSFIRELIDDDEIENGSSIKRLTDNEIYSRIKKFDNKDTLERWYNCFDDLSWAKNGRFEMGDLVKWNDPDFESYSDEDQKIQSERGYQVIKYINEDERIVLIADDFGEVEVYADELELTTTTDNTEFGTGEVKISICSNNVDVELYGDWADCNRIAKLLKIEGNLYINDKLCN
jgi:hypothetical protein